MNELALTIRLELELAEGSLSGSAVDPDGERTAFIGRLGLLATIDALVAAAIEMRTDTTPTSARRT